MILDKRYSTWQKVIPVVFGCSHKITFEIPTIFLNFLLRPELEVVGVRILGRGDAADTIIHTSEAVHQMIFNRL